jgi:hypothetical protein
MFQRFAAASAIASIAIALGALSLILTASLTFQRIYPLTIIWCLAPSVWGIWALIAPTAWVPQRLPLWGAILGLIAGLLAAFVLNMPSRVLGQAVSFTVRGVGAGIMAVFYYLLWILVRVAYRSLASTTAVYKSAAAR